MPKFKLTEKQLEELVKLYQNPSVPMDKLCQMFRVSDDTILRAMKREGIPMRITIGLTDEKNGNWKGGYSLRYAKNLAIRYSKKEVCAHCGYSRVIDVHHWDGNNKNNTPKNLILLCPNHHREIHMGLLTKQEILRRGVEQ